MSKYRSFKIVLERIVGRSSVIIQANIKKISVYMADQQVSAVVRSKISKRKIAIRDDIASDKEVYSL